MRFKAFLLWFLLAIIAGVITSVGALPGLVGFILTRILLLIAIVFLFKRKKTTLAFSPKQIKKLESRRQAIIRSP